MSMVVYDHISEKIEKDFDEHCFLVTDNIKKYVEPLVLGNQPKPSKESNCRKRQPIPEGRKRLKDGVV